MRDRYAALVLAGSVLVLVITGISGMAAADTADNETAWQENGTATAAQFGDGDGTDTGGDTDTDADTAPDDGQDASGPIRSTVRMVMERPLLVMGVLSGVVVAGFLYQQTGAQRTAHTGGGVFPSHRKRKLESELETVTQQVRNRSGDASQLSTDDIQLAFRLLRKARRALRNDDHDTARIQIDRIYALYRQDRSSEPAG